MEIIKRNLTSIICGVVALLSTVAVTVWPVPGWFESLSTRLAESSSDFSTLQSLNSETFKKPIVDPTKTEGEDLGQFPNEKTIAAGEEVVKELQGQVSVIEKKAVEINKHRPLVPEALPTKKTGYAWNTFKIEYYNQLKVLMAAMKALPAPTDREIEAESTKLREEFEKKKTRVGGIDVVGEGLEEMLNRQLLALPEQMRRNRAKEAAVFISNQDLMDTCKGIMPAADTADLPTLEQIWAAQLSLWIQEDVVRAIAETNGPNTTVETSIVKRLVRWDIPKQYVTSNGRADILNAMPSSGSSEGAAAADSTAGTKVYSVSVTGRVSNPTYDVVHFTVVVDADALQFRKFMANLSKDRFITILRADIIGVDRDREQARGYMYGPNPVVRLALRCEALMFRSWTTPWMPKSIKDMLLIQDEQKPAQDGNTPVAGAQ